MPSNQVPQSIIKKDVTLMSPGMWNGWNYSFEELKKAFELTNWEDNQVTNLFLDHPENSHNAAGQWAGRVINQKQLADGTVVGDLEIWDQQTIINIELAKAKFGVSPRVIGKENEISKSFTDFVFDNFSIVSKPAQSTAMINLNSNESFEGFVIKHLNKEDAEINKEEIIKKIKSLAEGYGLELTSDTLLEKKKKYLKGGLKKKEMNEEEEKNEEEISEETSEVVSEEGKEVVEEKELSDSDALGIMNDNFEDFNLYAKGIRAGNPTIGLKELAKGFTSHKHKLSMVDNLSTSEATIMLKKLLNKVGVSELSESPAKEQSPESSLVKELSSQISSLAKQVKELSNKKSPAAKAVRGPSASDSQPVEKQHFGHSASEGVQELSSYLKQLSR